MDTHRIINEAVNSEVFLNFNTVWNLNIKLTGIEIETKNNALLKKLRSLCWILIKQTQSIIHWNHSVNIPGIQNNNHDVNMRLSNIVGRLSNTSPFRQKITASATYHKTSNAPKSSISQQQVGTVYINNNKRCAILHLYWPCSHELVTSITYTSFSW